MPQTYNLTIYRGDAFKRVFALADSNAIPIDLTSKTITAQCRTDTSLTAKLLFAFTVTYRDDANGEFHLELLPADTAKVAAGVYAWDLQIGDKTYLAGELELQGDVSR